MKKILIIFIWISCGIISAGFMHADMINSIGYPAYWTKQRIREDVGMAVGFGILFGPVGLIISPFLTGFYQYGWSLSLTS